MTDSESFSTVAFDNAIDAAWASYRRTLADRLADGGLPHEIEAPGRMVPYLRFTETGRRRLRGEIPAAARYLAKLTDTDIELLTGSGWQLRKSGALVLEVGRRFPDQLAAQSVSALRGVFQIPHPVFFDAAAHEHTGAILAAKPREYRDLQNLAAHTTAHLLEYAVDRDEYGDICLYVGPRTSQLCARFDEPALEFAVTVIESVDDAESIRAELDVCRRLWRDINFVFDDGRLVASLVVESTVYVDKNLESALAKWVAFMQTGFQDVVDRLSSAAAADLPPALMCLLHLENLDAAQISRVCAGNRDDILAYIKVCSGQVGIWREAARDATDRDEAIHCGGEADAWEHTRQLLIGALRHTVLGD